MLKFGLSHTHSSAPGLRAGCRLRDGSRFPVQGFLSGSSFAARACAFSQFPEVRFVQPQRPPVSIVACCATSPPTYGDRVIAWMISSAWCALICRMDCSSRVICDWSLLVLACAASRISLLPASAEFDASAHMDSRYRCNLRIASAFPPSRKPIPVNRSAIGSVDSQLVSALFCNGFPLNLFPMIHSFHKLFKLRHPCPDLRFRTKAHKETREPLVCLSGVIVLLHVDSQGRLTVAFRDDLVCH